MRMKLRAGLALLAVGLIGLTGSANAAPISWFIVSSASIISLAIPNQTLTITSHFEYRVGSHRYLAHRFDASLKSWYRHRQHPHGLDGR